MSDETERDTGPPWPAWPDGFAATDEDRRALLMLAALRLFGGIFGLLITLVLILLVAHILAPGFRVPGPTVQ